MDYGKDEDLLWIVFLQKNGECWIYPNPQIRAVSEHHVWPDAGDFGGSAE